MSAITDPQASIHSIRRPSEIESQEPRSNGRSARLGL
jgi:hypothetical protein